jgi:hypothetical protein
MKNSKAPLALTFFNVFQHLSALALRNFGQRAKLGAPSQTLG